MASCGTSILLGACLFRQNLPFMLQLLSERVRFNLGVSFLQMGTISCNSVFFFPDFLLFNVSLP
jgi:hypothetical protein